MTDVSQLLDSVEAALIDADATLCTDLGGESEVTNARLWRGEVLVDWEADAEAGGCLLRPELLRRLLALNAHLSPEKDALVIHARGNVLSALSPHHAELVRRLGGARRVEMTARLTFTNGIYSAGHETYVVVDRGRRVPLLRLTAKIVPRLAPNAANRGTEEDSKKAEPPLKPARDQSQMEPAKSRSHDFEAPTASRPPGSRRY